MCKSITRKYRLQNCKAVVYKTLGIDYGEKRTGIAISDALNIIASPLCSINTTEIFNFLDEIIVKEKIDSVVIGEPKNLNGTPTDSSAMIEKFIIALSQKFPLLKIHRMDERFTSKIAQKAILASGVSKKKRRDKYLVDKVSASIILQSFLNA